MILLIHTSTAAKDVSQRLGKPEYSYRFVVQEFKPLLEQIGTVIEVADPQNEVDAIYEACAARGEPCIFLCFMPPSKTPIDLKCPTIPVYAWEFDHLPDEAFGGKPRNDWRRVLARLGAALTHSSYTVARTRAAMGPNFPVECVPAPLWDRIQAVRRMPPPAHVLPVNGLIIDSTRTDLRAYRKSARIEALPDILPLPPNLGEYQGSIDMNGIVYTAIFNPGDARKRWMQMINAFCEALHDKSDATLLLKLTHHDPSEMLPNMLEAVYTMGPVSCRVLFVHAYLEEPEYNAMLRNTTYVLNVSSGEGQCLPLMEYMSAGIPAVACRHTSMSDYIDSECAFIIDSSPEPGTWPHDQRQSYRTVRQRTHYHSLVSAYRNSYYVAKHEPDVYAAMSDAAVRSLERYCSVGVVRPRLQHFLQRSLDRHMLSLAQTRDPTVIS